MHADGPKKMRLHAEGPAVVTASQIITGPDIEVMDPDHVICTLDDGARLNMELTLNLGKGYVPATSKRPEDSPIGLIPVDAPYTPARKGSSKVENKKGRAPSRDIGCKYV